jgi:hypothetical protein
MARENRQKEGEDGVNRGIDDIKSAVVDTGPVKGVLSSGQPLTPDRAAEFTPMSQEVVGGEPSAPGAVPAPGDAPVQGGYAGMQPSMLGASEEEDQQQDGEYMQQQPRNQQMGTATYPAEMDYGSGAGNYAADAYATDAYQQYQPYQEVMSSDVITEISEQVVTEKLSVMQDKLEKALDFRSVAETRISSLNERLRRIEQILDRLQLSILQKVGDYINDVRDIKHELLETQKSFKAIAPSLRKSSKIGKSKSKSFGIVP